MEAAPQNTQIVKLQEKVKAANLPPELAEKAQSMIEMLQGVNSFSNFESVSNYVNYITSIPFNMQTQDILELSNSKQILDKNHYGLEPVKDRIIEHLASIVLSKQNKTTDGVIRAPILCLVGLVGTGKTTLAYSIAEALGRKFERIPFGGMGGANNLRGQSRVYPDAEPGVVIKKLIHAGSKNPVILLDELDRVTEAARADIMGVLVELLDPEQNKGFTDHYIDYPVDLSNVLFVATANNTANVSTAVLDRLEIIQMPSYNDAEKTTIGRSYLFPKIKRTSGLLDNQITIDDAVWPLLIRPLGFDSGIRSLERTIEGVCRKAARMVVEKKTNSVKITADNYREYLSI